MLEVGKELKRIRELNELSARKFAQYIGIDADRLRKWESAGHNPKEEDALLIEDYFKVGLEDLNKIQKFQFFSKAKDNVKVEEPAGTITGTYTGKYTDEIVRDLAHSAAVVGESNKLLSAANTKILDQNSELISVIKLAYGRQGSSTSSEATEAQIQESRNLAQTFDQMAEAGIPERWATVAEGRLFLNNLLAYADQKIQSSGKTSNKDKMSKA